MTLPSSHESHHFRQEFIAMFSLIHLPQIDSGWNTKPATNSSSFVNIGGGIFPGAGSGFSDGCTIRKSSHNFNMKSLLSVVGEVAFCTWALHQLMHSWFCNLNLAT